MARRRLFLGLLAALLTSSLAPAVLAPITDVSVRTDRSDYVEGMTVTAVATFNFTAAYNQVNDDATAEWFNETWVRLRLEAIPKTEVVNNQVAEAVATWVPPGPGLYRVNVSSAIQDGSATIITATANFKVWSVTDYVIALGIQVTTDKTSYEVGQLAIATADLTADSGWIWGNASLLTSVLFTWRYPSGAIARQSVNASLVAGRAVDTWSPGVTGVNYVVNATYQGNDTTTNWTAFRVFPPSSPVTNVIAGQVVNLEATGNPWRVCGDVLVESGGTLVIQEGVEAHFCRGSRLRIEGTLLGDGSQAAPIRLTSYEWPPAPGDWNGLWFDGAAPSHLVDAIIEFVTDGLVVLSSDPVLVGLVLRNGTDEGFNLTNSAATVRDSSVAGFAHGLRLWSSPARIDNVTLAANSRNGAYVYDSDGAVLRGLAVTGGNYSLRAFLSENLVVEESTFSSAAFWAVSLTGTAATIVNSTIAAATGGQDFLLVQSTATLRNSVFADDAGRRTLVAPSSLIVENYLAVEVRTSGAGLPSARIEVFVNDAPFAIAVTGPSGLVEWIVIRDRVHTANLTTKNTVIVAVSHEDFEIGGSPRQVDMATSHRETFLAQSLVTTVLGIDVRIFAGLIFAAFLIAISLLLWRRNHEDSAEGTTPPQELVPGTSYVVLAEKPDAAFERFATDVQAGATALCITRIRPEDARVRYGLGDVPIYWLSRTIGKEALNPTNLGAIVDLIRKRTEGKPGSRVFMDGIEYLFTQNEFGKVAKFVQAMADVVAQAKAVLLLPLDPRSLDGDRLAILTRDLRRWP